MSDSDWITDLTSRAGEALLARLADEPLTPATELAVITRLRREYAPELVAAAVAQTKLRRRARAKFDRADRMLFTPAGLEQASSERMARHHARRLAPYDRLADLCTGIGGDLIALADGHAVLGVDLDADHLRLAQHNAGVYGVADSVAPLRADVRAAPLDGLAAAFIDPARRSAERRMGGAQSEPPLDWCFALEARLPALGIKAAPALPADLVPSGWELEFVAEHRELKESLLWSPALATTARRATVLPDENTLIAVPGDAVPVRAPGAYLLDPDPAVTRAGLVEDLARALGPAWKIDEQVAFLSSDEELHTAFARTLRVEASFPWSLARLRTELRALGIGRVDIRKRGSAVEVEDVLKRLKLSGDRSATVVLTRVSDRPWAFVATSVPGLMPSE